MAVASIREEGAASRVKDSEDRLKIYEAIGKLHKDVNTIKRTFGASKLHPYNAGWLLSATSLVFGSCSISPLSSRLRLLPSSFYIPPLPPTNTPLPTTERLRGIISTLAPEVIDPRSIKDIPNPSPSPLTSIDPALPLPTSTISASPKEDSLMAGNSTTCNKETRNPPLNCSQYVYNGPPRECGGAKAPPPMRAAPPSERAPTPLMKVATTTSETPPKVEGRKKVKERSKGSKQKPKATSSYPPESSTHSQTPTPSSRPSDPPTHAPPSANALDDLRIEAIEHINKELKRDTEHKKRYQKEEARIEVEKQGKEMEVHSQDDSVEVLIEEWELHLRKALDRVAKEALILDLNKILKDEKRAPLHLAKVARVKKELEEQDSKAQITPAEEEYRCFVKAEVREGHYRKDEGPLKTYLRNEKVITWVCKEDALLPKLRGCNPLQKQILPPARRTPNQELRPALTAMESSKAGNIATSITTNRPISTNPNKTPIERAKRIYTHEEGKESPKKYANITIIPQHQNTSDRVLKGRIKAVKVEGFKSYPIEREITITHPLNTSSEELTHMVATLRREIYYTLTQLPDSKVVSVNRDTIKLVILGISGKKGEKAQDRVDKIIQELDIPLAMRSAKWLEETDIGGIVMRGNSVP
ncbi:hypothetical protein BGX38DRAFT_1280117 [Terfezia claveryi]|nr:hypothetical protein BGX38DRAFT_1280117 [Terfezia claveryi]